MTMYRITNDGRTLFDPRHERFALEGAVLRQEQNRLSALEFTIYPTHPEYSRISKAESALSLYRGGELVAQFRPVTARAAFRGGVTHRCEELAGRLNDALARPETYEGTVAGYIARAIVTANEALMTMDGALSALGGRDLSQGMTGEDVRLMQAALMALSYDLGRWGADGIFGAATRAAVCAFQKDGGLTVTGVFDAAALEVLSARLDQAGLTGAGRRGAWPPFVMGRVAHCPDEALSVTEYGYMGCWDALQKHVVTAYGGYIVPRYQDGVIYIDYLGDEDLPEGAQTIRFGRNLADLTVDNDVSDTFTALIPLGKALPGGGRLTVASVNGGSDRIDSEAGLALYGRREKTVVWDEEDSAARLLARGRAYLSAYGARLTETIDVRAVDLSLIAADTPPLRFMTRHRVVSAVHGVDGWYTLGRLDAPLGDPGMTRLRLGSARPSLTDSVSGRDTPSGQALMGLSGTGERLARPVRAMIGPQADGCAASASSQQGDRSAAWRAFDYTGADGWLSAPRDPAPWLQLALDRPLRNLRVYVYSRSAGDADNPTEGTVLASQDGASWREIGRFSGWSVSARGALLGVVACPADEAVSCVRIAMPARSGRSVGVGYVIVTGEAA